MASSLTEAMKPVSKATQMMGGGSQSGQTDIDEDLRELIRQTMREELKSTVKQAIYEVRDEQQRGSGQSQSSGQGGSQRQQSQSKSKSGSSGGSSSGSGPVKQLFMLAGLAVIGYMTYKRRKSGGSATHRQHSGEVQHTSASDLPPSETSHPEAEPPNTSDSSEASDGGTVGVDEDVVAPDPDEDDS